MQEGPRGAGLLTQPWEVKAEEGSDRGRASLFLELHGKRMRGNRQVAAREIMIRHKQKSPHDERNQMLEMVSQSLHLRLL